MTTDTLVQVTIGSEVSASVPATPFNTVATSTETIGFIQEIINFVVSWF